MIPHVAQTDNAVCTEGVALACGLAFNGSAHSWKHFRHVQNHFQSMLSSLDTLLGQGNCTVKYMRCGLTHCTERQRSLRK
jgi:hypothetical protein